MALAQCDELSRPVQERAGICLLRLHGHRRPSSERIGQTAVESFCFELLPVDAQLKTRDRDNGRMPLKHAAGESVGIAKFSASAAQLLFKVLDRRRRHNEFYEASFQELIDSGSHVYAVDSAPYRCMEIDTIEDLARAERVAAELPQ